MNNLKEKFLLHGVFPFAEKFVGTNAYYWYQQICDMNKWTPQQIEKWQNERLNALVKHAYEHTVYYRNMFDDLGLKPIDIQTAADLHKIPIMTKEIANVHFAEIVPSNLHEYHYRDGKTGGTTGEPMFYHCDENTWGYVTAAKIYAWKTMSYRYGDAFAAMGSASLFGKKMPFVRHIYDWIRNEIPMNTVNLTDELCKKYVQVIIEKKIRYIYGYAASIYIFTQYVHMHNINLTQIEGVFSTSENMTDEYRELIEQTYQCHVMDCYGARDAGITAYEIERHCYHVGYNAIAEIINPIEKNTGSIITTNLLNYSFPLLRYQFGDEAELSPIRGGNNNYNGQTIKRILGRTSDVMRMENGHNMTATGFSMIMKDFDIKAFSFNKTGVNEISLTIQPIEGKFTTKQEKEIRRVISLYIGSDATLHIEYIDHFNPLANGKRHYFMNKII